MSSFRKNPSVEEQLSRQAKMGLALRFEAHKAEVAAKAIAPVLSGKYKEGIRVDMGTDASGNYLARLNATDFKSHWIELGTSKFPARAVLRRGADAAGLKVRGGRRA